jgi:hypothetical protein
LPIIASPLRFGAASAFATDGATSGVESNPRSTLALISSFRLRSLPPSLRHGGTSRRDKEKPLCSSVNMLFSCANFSCSSCALFFHKETRKPRVFKTRILGSWVPYGFSVAATPRWVLCGGWNPRLRLFPLSSFIGTVVLKMDT